MTEGGKEGKRRSERGKTRDGYVETRRWEGGGKSSERGRRREMEEARGEAEGTYEHEAREYTRAPPRRVGPTPTRRDPPASTRTDSHRVHAALTYIQPAFTTGETACRSNKRCPGHARRAGPTTRVEDRSLFLSLPRSLIPLVSLTRSPADVTVSSLILPMDEMI